MVNIRRSAFIANFSTASPISVANSIMKPTYGATSPEGEPLVTP